MGKALVINDVDFSALNLGKVTTGQQPPVWTKEVADHSTADAEGWFAEAGGMAFFNNPSQKWTMFIEVAESCYQKKQNFFSLYDDNIQGLWVCTNDFNPNWVAIGYPTTSVRLAYNYAPVRVAIKFTGTEYFYTTDGISWTLLATRTLSFTTGKIGTGENPGDTNLGGVKYVLYNTDAADIRALFQ